jgi:hypothetical protein
VINRSRPRAQATGSTGRGPRCGRNLVEAAWDGVGLEAQRDPAAGRTQDEPGHVRCHATQPSLFVNMLAKLHSLHACGFQTVAHARLGSAATRSRGRGGRTPAAMPLTSMPSTVHKRSPSKILPLRAAGPAGARPFTTSPSPPGPAPDSPASKIIPMPTALDESAPRRQGVISPRATRGCGTAAACTHDHAAGIPAGAGRRQHALTSMPCSRTEPDPPGNGVRSLRWPALRFWLNPRLMLGTFSRAGCRTFRQSHPRPSHDIPLRVPTPFRTG